VTADPAVRPIYLCIERALLVGPDQRAVRAALGEFLREMQASALSSEIRASVIAFAAEIAVLQTFSEPRDWDPDPGSILHLPRESKYPPPVFGRLFAYLRRTILADLRQVTEDGYAVRRPCVCLVSNGLAEDEWEADHRWLIDYDSVSGSGFRERPDIIAVPGVPKGSDSPSDMAALRRMVMPRRKAGILDYTDKIDAAAVFAAVVVPRRPVL